MKILIKKYLPFILVLQVMPIYLEGQISGSPGAFIRMGFGNSGIGLANAGVAVTYDTEKTPFYNPALLGLQEKTNIGVAYTYLSLDRLLNFAYAKLQVGKGVGLAFSFINSAVTGIDFRDASGNSVGSGFVTENALIVSYGNKLAFGIPYLDNFSLGISARLYLGKLHDNIPLSFALGFDFGIVFKQPLTADSLHVLSAGFSISDVNTKWQWISDGQNSLESFPLSIKTGLSYVMKKVLYMEAILITLQTEILNRQFLYYQKSFNVMDNGTQTTSVQLNTLLQEVFFQMGLAIEPVKYLRIRGGLDQLPLNNLYINNFLKWTVGFSVFVPMPNEWTAEISYVFVYEQHTSPGTSVVSIGITF